MNAPVEVKTLSSNADLRVVGEDTHQTVVYAKDCPAFEQAGIAHAGVSDAAFPYRVVRPHLSGAFLLGTLEGRGEMLLDGRWQSHVPGRMSLAPAHSLHAFHAVKGSRWKTCWVRFAPEAALSKGSAITPLISDFDNGALQHAILGLHEELQSVNGLGSAMLWVALIQHYAQRFMAHSAKDRRLASIFAVVQSNLAHRWSVQEMAALVHLSPEHLRRLCIQTLGRTPMQQVTHLRVQHAAHLLATQEHKVEVIASEVGYDSPFAFSNVFKRFTGFRPSEMRKQSTQGANPPVTEHEGL